MESSFQILLTTGLSHLEVRLYHRLLAELDREFGDWPGHPRRTNESPDALKPALLVDFLKERIGREMEQIETLRKRFAEFNRLVGFAKSEEERRHYILGFAHDLGSGPRELKQDEKAFERWFGPDAMADRYQRRHSYTEFKVAFLLQRLGILAALCLDPDSGLEEQVESWRRLGLEQLVKPFFAYDGDARVNLAAFRCLATALVTLQSDVQEIAVDDSTLQFIFRSALRSQQDAWLQCAALELLPSLSPSSFEKVLQQRLTNPLGEGDIFVRRRGVDLLGRYLPRQLNLLDLIPAVASDPSPFVRQALPRALQQAPVVFAATWLRVLARDDAAPEVRAATLIEFTEFLPIAEIKHDLVQILLEVFAQESHDFVLRTACFVAERITEILAHNRDELLSAWLPAVPEALARLHVNAASLKVRRWAAQSYEVIWCETHPEARALRLRLQEQVSQIPRGKTRRLPRDLILRHDPELLCRVLATLSLKDFDYEVEVSWQGLFITRGHVFGFRWWRWLFEFRHPSPDKRQAFQHTVGRIFNTRLQVPSAILGELAQTKVPGEPLQIPEEGGWRPYLPLVDQFMSSLDQGFIPQPVKVFTSEGVTTIRPPRGWRVWWAGLNIIWKFRDLAEQRNWRESYQSEGTTYLRQLTGLGFKVEFAPHADAAGQPLPADPSVTRFFPAFLLPGPVLDLWGRMQDYFISLYQNTLWELGLFVGIFIVLFFSLHIYFNIRLRRGRRRIPLVIGGWGTRGKSGTERLKGALFNAVGFGLVSKTTGCEAMFLQAYPFGEMKEMFLFRPYDKATIWEQVNVARIAGALHSDVMLWECMGLTPSYVEILQRRWMRDDLSTITNTYPDHEDLQGPAGVNIPEVISSFIPERSELITSEETMLPILREQARKNNTAVHPVTWLDAGLITPDVLQRFPYDEHPYNIALVLGLAGQIGIERDFALKELADRVVPDLGVLKTYPRATLRGRRLEFANGMSANERFGTLSNWVRTGFDRQDYRAEPGVWLTTVVNNRADRVPRSQVFAGILVNDISADRHVLIGGNLNGLQGYIREQWAEHVAQLSLWKEHQTPNPAEALKVLEQCAVSMRLSYTPALVQTNLRLMLQSQPQLVNAGELLARWDQPDTLKTELSRTGVDGEILDAILRNLAHDLAVLQSYTAMADQLRAATPEQAASLDTAFRACLSQWFFSKFIVIEHYFATGDQIIDLLCQNTPPGFLNRIMGIQNIKGTGLDFVYRWQAWDTCYHAAQPLRAEKVTLTPQNLRKLSAFQEYGLLCEEYVRETIERIRTSGLPQRKELLAELDGISSNLNAVMTKVYAQMRAENRQSGWLLKALLFVEEFLDAGDAVKRRKMADQVYQDLIDERISRERAVIELQTLTKRQKGGWLLKKLQSKQAEEPPTGGASD